jgi:hypothetical protein
MGEGQGSDGEGGMKTLEENFIDWESEAFGFGYGSGELYILPDLKTFFEHVGRGTDRPNSYDYRELESALGGAVAWLLINVLCHANILEYGTSPRFGWLTKEGEALQSFIATKTADELVSLCTEYDDNYVVCSSDACNCGPKGYQEGVKCQNPFWPNR